MWEPKAPAYHLTPSVSSFYLAGAVYSIQAGSWISWILYTSWISWELGRAAQAGTPLTPRDYTTQIFELDHCSTSASEKLTAPIFGLRKAAMFGSQSGASRPAASRFSVNAIFRSKFRESWKIKNFFLKNFKYLTSCKISVIIIL